MNQTEPTLKRYAVTSALVLYFANLLQAFGALGSTLVNLVELIPSFGISED